MIKCKVCGKAFEPAHWNQRYCSPECVHEAELEQGRRYRRKHPKKINERYCVICGSPFIPASSSQKTCSGVCRTINNKRVHSGYNKEYYQKSKRKTLVKCAVCGKEFRQKKTYQKYCSEECRKKVQREKTLEWQRGHRTPAVRYPCSGMYGNIPINVCLNCSAEICRYEK